MGGFTTVQSVGSPINSDLRDLINAGVIPGHAPTSLRAVTDPETIRAYVRKMKEDGADVIKLFATASIRDGGKQTMTDEQVLAACSEAKALTRILSRWLGIRWRTSLRCGSWRS
jgi:hypothetical protein